MLKSSVLDQVGRMQPSPRALPHQHQKQVGVISLYLYQMLIQNTLRTCKKSRYLYENYFSFSTAADVNKCLKQIELPISLHPCTSISVLPWLEGYVVLLDLKLSYSFNFIIFQKVHFYSTRFPQNRMRTGFPYTCAILS